MTVDIRWLAEWAVALTAIGGVLAAALRWMEGRMEQKLERCVTQVMTGVAKQLTESIERHNADAQAHPNHHVGQEFQKFVEERRHALEMVVERLAKSEMLVLERIARQDVSLAQLSTQITAMTRALDMLRESHDAAIEKGICLYQQARGGGRS
jgi:hypothetical protein